MRVAFFSNPPEDGVDGTIRSVDLFAKGLRALGEEVALVEKAEELQDFAPDLVHAHSHVGAGTAAFRFASERNLPLVLTHHSIDFENPSAAVSYSNHCDFVIAPTPSIAELIQRQGVTAAIAVVPTGIEVDVFARGDGPSFRRNHGIPQDSFVIGHLGRLIPSKRISYLSSALSIFLTRHPHSYALICGEGSEKSALMAEFAATGAADRLRILGYLPDDQIADAYAAMDLFAFASLRDTQGIVLLEAMAAGIPVLAHRATGPQDLIIDGTCGWLLPPDSAPTTFTAAMEDIFRLPDRSAWSVAARQRAKEYDWLTTARHLLQQYQRVLSQRLS